MGKLLCLPQIHVTKVPQDKKEKEDYIIKERLNRCHVESNISLDLLGLQSLCHIKAEIHHGQLEMSLKFQGKLRAGD